MKYSLANHILSVKPNDAAIDSMFGTISIGGEGSYLDSINIRKDRAMWNTEGYSTGAWVHNKDMSKIGTVDVSLNQLTDIVAKFITLCETYYTGDYEGFTLTVTRNDGTVLCTCIDCYITKIPDQSFTNSASNQTWTFTCGQVNFN